MSKRAIRLGERLRQTAVFHRTSVHVRADVRPCPAPGRIPRDEARNRNPLLFEVHGDQTRCHIAAQHRGDTLLGRGGGRQRKHVAAIRAHREAHGGTSHGHERDDLHRVPKLRGLGAQKLPAGGYLREEIPDLDGCTDRMGRGLHRLGAGESDGDNRPLGGIAGAARDQKLRDAADRGQGLPAEAARSDVLEVGRVSELRGGMPLDREPQVARGNALAVVAHPDEALAALLDVDDDARGFGVERVLDQFLNHRSGPFDHLARGDLVDDVVGESLDRLHDQSSSQERAAGPSEIPACAGIHRVPRTFSTRLDPAEFERHPRGSSPRRRDPRDRSGAGRSGTRRAPRPRGRDAVRSSRLRTGGPSTFSSSPW